VKARQTR